MTLGNWSNWKGLIEGHAYSVVKVVKVVKENGKAVKLVQLRNPWGKGEFEGAWSDNSKLWTEDLKQ